MLFKFTVIATKPYRNHFRSAEIVVTAKDADMAEQIAADFIERNHLVAEVDSVYEWSDLSLAKARALHGLL